MEKGIEYTQVIRTEGGRAHVLRENLNFNLWQSNTLSHNIYDASTGNVISEESFKACYLDIRVAKAVSFLFGQGLAERAKKTEEYWGFVRKFKEKNLSELMENIKDIRIYQGSIEEVSRESACEAKRVDTGKPETYLKAENELELRIKAYYLGADAIVHCQPGSAIGTPVKFYKK